MITQHTPIPVEVSARHVHLNKADWSALFGSEAITSDHPISQQQQYVAVQRVTLKGPKREMTKVGIVGPLRPYTQVELSTTDAWMLGIKAPLSDSGVLHGAGEITIVGPKGEITRPAGIVPKRHIHISPKEATAAGLKDRQIVSVHISGKRGAQLENVTVRIHKDFSGRLHLDTDEGNACGVQPGMTAEIIT